MAEIVEKDKKDDNVEMISTNKLLEAQQKIVGKALVDLQEATLVEKSKRERASY